MAKPQQIPGKPFGFFHKISPNTPIHLSNGHKVLFTRVTHEDGIICTQDELAIKEMRILQQKGWSGVTELTEVAWREWLKKKPSHLPPRSREQFGKEIIDEEIRKVLQFQQPNLRPNDVVPAAAVKPSSPAPSPAPDAPINPATGKPAKGLFGRPWKPKSAPLSKVA